MPWFEEASKRERREGERREQTAPSAASPLIGPGLAAAGNRAIAAAVRSVQREPGDPAATTAGGASRASTPPLLLTGPTPPLLLTGPTPPLLLTAPPESAAARRRRQQPAVNVLPSGPGTLVTDETGRAYPAEVFEQIATKGARATREAQNTPGVKPTGAPLASMLETMKLRAGLGQVDDPVAAVRENQARKAELGSALGEMPALLLLVTKEGGDLAPEDHGAFKKLHDECEAVLRQLVQQAAVSVGERDAAVAKLATLKAQVLVLQHKATQARARREEINKAQEDLPGQAELVTKEGIDLAASDHAEFNVLHDECVAMMATVSGAAIVGVTELADALDKLAALKARVVTLQEKGETTRQEIAANKATITALVKRAGVAFRKIFGTFGTKFPPIEEVKETLQFDKVVLHGDASLLATDLLNANKETRPAPPTVLTARVADLETRVAESLGFIADIEPRTPAEMANSSDVTLVNNSMRQAWDAFVREAAKPARDLTVCRAKTQYIRSEIDRKTPVKKEDLYELIKADKANKRLRTFPDSLLVAADNNLVTVKKGLAYETRVSVLKDLFEKVDTPSRLPGILAEARVHGLTSEELKGVLTAVGGTTTTASSLFSRVSALPGSPNMSFFLKGAGGQRAADLQSTLPRVWSGQRAAGEPAYEPAGQTFGNIKAVAVPKEGTSRPANGGYAGNRAFGNGGNSPDMLLPRRTAADAGITYTEFDIKPYYPWINRGVERVVEGSDGRRYYTSDHYQTYKLIP